MSAVNSSLLAVSSDSCNELLEVERTESEKRRSKDLLLFARVSVVHSEPIFFIDASILARENYL